MKFYSTSYNYINDLSFFHSRLEMKNRDILKCSSISVPTMLKCVVWFEKCWDYIVLNCCYRPENSDKHAEGNLWILGKFGSLNCYISKGTCLYTLLLRPKSLLRYKLIVNIYKPKSLLGLVIESIIESIKFPYVYGFPFFSIKFILLQNFFNYSDLHI